MAHSAYHNPQESAVAGLKTIAIVNALCNPNPVGQAYAIHELYQGYKNLITYLASCPADTLAYELGKLAGQTTVTATSLHGVSKICLNSAQKFQQASQAVHNQATKIHRLTDNEILQLAPNIIEARVMGTAADGTPIYGLTEPTPLPSTTAGPSSLPVTPQPQLTTSQLPAPPVIVTTLPQITEQTTTSAIIPAVITHEPTNAVTQPITREWWEIYENKWSGNTIKQFDAQKIDMKKINEHVFSDNHVTRGLLNIANSRVEAFDKIVETIKIADAKNLLKNGLTNQIYTIINSQGIEIRVHIEDGVIISINAFTSTGEISRNLGNIIKLV